MRMTTNLQPNNVTEKKRKAPVKFKCPSLFSNIHFLNQPTTSNVCPRLHPKPPSLPVCQPTVIITRSLFCLIRQNLPEKFP